jgi:HD-GYP domain-containing protein (c-di-GMP phosphodiesterase class II)
MALKRIPLNALTVGMYLCGIDQSWLNTPFLVHRFLIKSETDIEKLRKCGIREIEIDTDRGIDIPDSPALETPPSSNEIPPPALPTPLSEELRIAQLPEALRGTVMANELSAVKHTRQQLLDEVRELLRALGKTGGISVDRVNQVTQSIVVETLHHEEAYIALLRAREFSPILYDHAVTVGTLAVLLGRGANLNESLLRNLGTAGLLHDVGLMCLPAQLHRPLNQLSPSESAIYQTHPQRGTDMLAKNPQLSAPVLTLIQEHHINLDGSGYPSTTLPHQLSVCARILRIVDEYDELLSGHQSGEPLSVRGALQNLYRKGQRGLLDPTLVAKLINVIGIYPTFSMVELNTGERGIVTGNSRDNLLEPTILLIQNADHQPLPEPIPFNFSVLPPDGTRPEIVGILNPEEVGTSVESILEDWIAL